MAAVTEAESSHLEQQAGGKDNELIMTKPFKSEAQLQ